MTRRADRTAARREARLRRAELSVLAASRAHRDAVDQVAADPLSQTPAADLAAETLAHLEAAALRYAEITPRSPRPSPAFAPVGPRRAHDPPLREGRYPANQRFSGPC